MMRSHKCTVNGLSLCLLLSTIAAPAVAQEVREAPRTPDEENVRLLRQNVKPSFLIKPLVHRLRARRGQLLRFEFSIENNTEGVRLDIRPVSMLQRENGAILPDPESPPPEVIRLMTAKSVVLSEGEEHIVRCQMRVPVTNAPFLSYGVLVREIPLQGNGDNRRNSDEPRVGIKFITQYLLRVDITVVGARGDSVSQLEMQDGTLIQEEGRPRVRLYVNNPTESPLEYSVSCHLRSLDTGSTGNEQKLAVPVRATQPLPARYQARILGETRLRMEEFLPDPVFPGDYELVVDLEFHGRTVKQQAFPLRIRSGDYPAQDASIVRVARDILVEPANVEMSLRRGGTRLQTLTIRNGSLQNIAVELKRQTGETEDPSWFSVRPARFALRPGRMRKVVVTPGRRRDLQEHQYGHIGLKVTPEGGTAIGEQQIPVALLTKSDSMPELLAGGIRWQADEGRYGFVLPLRNDGRRHAALDGRMTLTDDFGRGTVIEAGFGRWLLPGAQSELEFLIRKFPPPGIYEMEMTVDQGAHREPLVVRKTVRLADPIEHRVSTGKQNTKRLKR